jgi:tetratricopeptide (TPR) repeat protein
MTRWPASNWRTEWLIILGHLGCLAGCAAPTAVALLPVPLPALEMANEAVRAQLETAHATLLLVDERREGGAAERANAYGDLGRLFLASALLTAAEPALRNARELAPDDVDWPYYLGYLYRGRGEIEMAARMFEDAVRLAPDDVPARVWLGRVYLDLDRPEAAADEFVQALALAPRAGAAQIGLGQAALTRGDYDGAVRAFERVLSEAPAASSVHYLLGLAYRGQGDEVRAEQQFAQRGDGEVVLDDPRVAALEVILDSALAYQRRGLASMNSGEWSEAVGLFQNGLAVAPGGDAALRLSLMHKLGSALWLAGDAAAAVEQFEAGVRLSPQFALNHYSLGVVAAARGNTDEAREWLESSLAHEPDLVEARIALASLLHGLGKTAEALPHYAQALKVAPDAADAQYGQALALVDLGRRADARGVLADGLERHPNDSRFTEALGAFLGL